MGDRDLQDPEPFTVGNNRELGPKAVGQGRGLGEDLLDDLLPQEPEAAVHVLQGHLRHHLGEDVETAREQDAMEGLVANHLAAHDNVVIGGVRPQPPEIVGIVLAVGIGEEVSGVWIRSRPSRTAPAYPFRLPPARRRIGYFFANSRRTSSVPSVLPSSQTRRSARVGTTTSR